MNSSFFPSFPKIEEYFYALYLVVLFCFYYLYMNPKLNTNSFNFNSSISLDISKTSAPIYSLFFSCRFYCLFFFWMALSYWIFQPHIFHLSKSYFMSFNNVIQILYKALTLFSVIPRYIRIFFYYCNRIRFPITGFFFFW